ncbi:MAG: hypothetical protein AB7P22_18255 [Vicinamibacterales bacterium]
MEPWPCASDPFDPGAVTTLFVDGWRSEPGPGHLSERANSHLHHVLPAHSFHTRCFSYQPGGLTYRRDATNSDARVHVPRLATQLRALADADTPAVLTLFSLGSALACIALARVLSDPVTHSLLPQVVPRIVIVGPVLFGLEPGYVDAVHQELCDPAHSNDWLLPEDPPILANLFDADGRCCTDARNGLARAIDAGTSVTIIYAESDGVSPYKPGAIRGAREIALTPDKFRNKTDGIVQHFELPTPKGPAMDPLVTELLSTASVLHRGRPRRSPPP